MTEESKRPAIFAKENIGSIISLCTAYVTASAYFAGYISRSIFLRFFGLSEEMIEEPYAATIVRGAIALMVLLIVIIPLFYILTRFLLKITLRFPATHKRLNKILNPTPENSGPLLATFSLVFIASSLGAAAGIVGGIFSILEVEIVPAGNCVPTKFVYEWKDGLVVGTLLVADKTRIAIVTDKNVDFIDNSKISKISNSLSLSLNDAKCYVPDTIGGI